MKIKVIPVFLVTTIVAMITMVIMARLGGPTSASLHLLRARHEADSKAVATEWGTNIFIPVTAGSFKSGLSELVANAVGVALLNDQQKQGLADELQIFFHAYSDGTYEAYRAFRFPPGIDFTWKTNKFGSIDQVLNKPPGFGIGAAYYRWHDQVEYRTNSFADLPKEEKFKVFLKLFSGDTLYSNYFSAASFNQAHVVINDFTTNVIGPWQIPFYPPHTFLTNLASVNAPFPNMGYFAQKPHYSLVEFADSLESIRNQFGKVATADCFFFVQRPAPDPVLPIIVRLYWNPHVSQWVPDDLVICSLWQKGDKWPLF